MVAPNTSTTTPEDDEEIQNTEIWSGAEEIVIKAIQSYPRVKARYDQCIDSAGPSIIIVTEPIVKAFIGLKDRGVKIRILTEITKDNLQYCKKLMPIISEMRPLDGVKGNFAVAEKDYVSIAVTRQANPLTQLVHSTVKALVEQQQYFFDMLWAKAIPAKQRIREIEEGEKREFVEVIRDPLEIQQIALDLVHKADEEILVLLSTVKAFYRQRKTGLLQSIREAAATRSVSVRILVPAVDINNDIVSNNNNLIHIEKENEIKRTTEEKQLKNADTIDIRQSKESIQNKLSMLIIDQSLSLTIEIKDDSKETFEDAIGLATYSNSEAIVLSYLLIFENLWVQTDNNNNRISKKNEKRKEK